MKIRCYYKNGKSYKNYGGRGIRVCDRWMKSFVDFYADMGPKPSPGHSLDRIDNNGDYGPGNCKWSTLSQQMRNKRTSKIIEGPLLMVVDLAGSKKKIAEICGISKTVVNRWNEIPERYVAAIAKVLKLKPKQLRPDIFT